MSLPVTETLLDAPEATIFIPAIPSVVITSTNPSGIIQEPFTETLLSGQATFPAISVTESKLPGEGLNYSQIFLIILGCFGGAFVIGAVIFAFIHRQRVAQDLDHRGLASESNGKDDELGEVHVAKHFSVATMESIDDEILSPKRKSLPAVPSTSIMRVNSTTSIASNSHEPSPLRNSLSAVDEDGIFVVKG